MGFNNVQPSTGPFVLWPGASMRVWVAWNDGSDHGAQWIMADPIDDGQGLDFALTVGAFTKRRIPVYAPFGDGGRHGTVVQYEVTITNPSSYVVRFTVQGGGNT